MTGDSAKADARELILAVATTLDGPLWTQFMTSVLFKGRKMLDRRPPLLYFTVDEIAVLLRTTRKAVYAMNERRQLPGATRIGRRLLFRTCDLLQWLDQKRGPSPKE